MSDPRVKIRTWVGRRSVRRVVSPSRWLSSVGETQPGRKHSPTVLHALGTPGGDGTQTRETEGIISPLSPGVDAVGSIANQKTIARLKDRPCADCGGHFPTFVMDFDHVRDKLSVVSTLVYSASTERLIAEATKCDVVCSNCHRMRTQHRLKNRQPKGGQRAPSETMPRASGLGQQSTQLEFTGHGM
jgi:hypothetical protein